MANTVPQSLPYSATNEYVAFPFEGDASGLIVSRGWFTILAGFGSVEYEVAFIRSDGSVTVPTAPPASGTLTANTRLAWELPINVGGVTLRYRCVTPNARLGYSFPQITK